MCAREGYTYGHSAFQLYIQYPISTRTVSVHSNMYSSHKQHKQDSTLSLSNLHYIPIIHTPHVYGVHIFERYF